MPRALKRAVDVAGAVGLLLLLLPLLIVIATGIIFTMGRPVLFTQIRSGRRGAPFTLLKFRSMTETVDASGRLAPDSHRLTPFGRWLRTASLDELPQLWNVVTGEMSLVGPRPLLPQYLSRYNEFQRRRLQVVPGITGWAQIHGRNALAWEPRFEYDVWYVDHWSLTLDARILARTLAYAAKGQGISAERHATMPEFQGSLEPALSTDLTVRRSSDP
jgi:lipopolysaccharide/colanic/teichoic acid biosynthesis glycosyltransferase